MKIAVLTSRFPFPLEKGDKLRLYHQIQGLYQAGHEIGLFALSEHMVARGDREVVGRWCRGGMQVYSQPTRQCMRNLAVGWPRGLPLQVAYFFQDKLVPAIRADLQAFQPDLVYCQLIRMVPYVLDWPGPKVLDYMDAFSGIMRKRAFAAHPVLRPFWKAETRRLRRYEGEVFAAFDGHTIISRRDKMDIAHPASEKISVVPNGVNTSFFKPFPAETPPFEIAFIGNMGYHPNVVAGRWLVEYLLPRLQRKYPGIRLLLAGARPARSILRLASPAVRVSGWVPDIREAYQQGQIFIAPLFHGGGQQNKILEAMAMERPCITTSHVNEAIGGRHRKELLIADHEEAFTQQVAFLLEHPDIAAEIGRRARRFVAERFSWSASNRQLEALLAGWVQREKPETPTTKK